MIDISDTLTAKSDQLNADDLHGGPITVKVGNVTKANTDQPITIRYEGDNGRPFKPCKTVRRVIAKAWGRDATQWAGRLMTLYNDPSVKWAGKPVGGIRVSHLSHIDGVLEINLSATRGVKQIYKVKPLAVSTQSQGAPPDQAAMQGKPADQSPVAEMEGAPNIRLIKNDGSEIRFDNFQAWIDTIGKNVPMMKDVARVDAFLSNHDGTFKELSGAGWGEWVQKALAIIEAHRNSLGGNVDGQL